MSDSLRPPWIVAYKAPLSMEFSKQEYWSGLPFPSPYEKSRSKVKRGPLKYNGPKYLYVMKLYKSSRGNKISQMTIGPYVQTGFRKGRGTKDQIANIRWVIEKAREFQINIYFSFVDYAEAFDCVVRNKLWKILKDMGIPDHLTCLLRNPYPRQETTRNGTTDCFQIGKGVHQGYRSSPYLFNLYAEYIM